MFSYAYYMKEKVCIGTYFTNTTDMSFPSVSTIRKEIKIEDATIVSVYEFKNQDDYISAQK
jgi:hypothetical protein